MLLRAGGAGTGGPGADTGAGTAAAGPATLHLVRHGESLWNRLGRIQGQSPLAPGLTARGWSQASAVAALLERRLAGDSRVRVVSSDLVRAHETARVIACRLGLPLGTSTSLREQRFGALEGLPLDSTVGEMPAREVVASLWGEVERRPPGGGESVLELSARATTAIRQLMSAGGAVVVVAHGGFIRAVLSDLLAVPGGRAGGVEPPVGNASLTTLVLEPGGSLVVNEPQSA